MDTLKLPKSIATSVTVRFTNPCDPKILFQTLSIDDDIVWFKFKETTSINTHSDNAEVSEFLDNIQQSVKCDYIDITVKLKSKYRQIRLYSDKIIVYECRGIQEASNIIKLIKTKLPTLELPIHNVETILVRYKYKIPESLNIDNITLRQEFKVCKHNNICKIKYNRTNFTICKGIVIQTSINETEAIQAFRALNNV